MILGLDRLHYLEGRLTHIGVRRDDAPDSSIFIPPMTPTGNGPSNQVLH